MRNKDNHQGNFGGPKHFSKPKAETEHAPLRPDGSIAPSPQDRMFEGGNERVMPGGKHGSNF